MPCVPFRYRIIIYEKGEINTVNIIAPADELILNTELEGKDYARQSSIVHIPAQGLQLQYLLLRQHLCNSDPRAIRVMKHSRAVAMLSG